MNKVTLMGRLGKDPEVKEVNGTQVSNFTLATTDRWTDKEGQKKEKTEWHRVICWGPMAKLTEKYLEKGNQVLIEGQVQYRTWENDEGKDQYMTEINAKKLHFIGSRNKEKVKGSGPSGAITMDDVPF